MRGVVIVAIFGILAKLAAAAREFVIAWRFGTSVQIDAYVFIFNIFGVPIAIWVGALSGVYIPRLVRLNNESPAQASLLQSEINGIALLGGAIVGIGSAGLSMALIKCGYSGLTTEVADLAYDMSWKLWPMIPMLFLVQVGSSQLMASRLHINTVYEGLPAIVLMLSVWAMPSVSSTALVFGTLSGATVQLLATQYSLWRVGGLAKFRLGLSSSAWRDLANGFWLLATAYVLQGACTLFDQFILARLGQGAIATFGYASRLLALAISLGGIAISRTILPVLSEIGRKDEIAFRRITLIWVSVMFLAGAALFGAFAIFAEPVVKLVFEHGAFSAQDSASVAGLVWFLAQTLPFYFAMTVLVQAQLASDGYRFMIQLYGIALALKFGLGLPLVWAYGVTGLAISNILVTAFQCAFLLYIFNKNGHSRKPYAGEG